MLSVSIPEQEVFDEGKNEFILIKRAELQLEHSLISLSKWEAKWHKPFLATKDKTEEEIWDYIRCMTLTKDVDPITYRFIPDSVLKQIFEYIEDPMTATWFSKTDEKKSGMGRREIITAEIIYYWMVTLNVPVQFEKWHLNRLITLIKVINLKNAPAKKMSQKDILAQNARLNAQRRARHRSKG